MGAMSLPALNPYAGNLGSDVRRNALDIPEGPGAGYTPANIRYDDPSVIPLGDGAGIVLGPTATQVRETATDAGGVVTGMVDGVKDLFADPSAPAQAPAPPKQKDRQGAEFDAMAAKVAFQKRMAAKQGYAGTFHASTPTRSSVGPTDVFRPPRQAGEPSMMDRLKWSTDPVWLFGPRGPFSGVKLPDLTPNPNRGSLRLNRK